MGVRHFSALLVFLIFSGTLFGQSAILRHQVNFEVENERFEDVMLSLAEENEFSFSYNPSMLPVDSLISLKVENSSLKTVLVTLLGKELEMKQRGNHLVILRTRYTVDSRSAQAGKNTRIEGYIRDASSGLSVSGATVYDVASLNSAITDDQGYYLLEIPVETPVIGITVSRADLRDTTIVISNESRNLNIPVAVPKGIGEGLSGGPDRLDSLKIVKMVAADEGVFTSQGLGLSLYRTAQISVVPFVGTNLKMSGVITNKYSLNVLAGYNGATKGIELGGLVNVTRYYVKGVQIAGLSNAVGHETSGVQLAGLFNTNLGIVKGVQIAGINNLVLDSLKGVQISGVSNVIQGRTDGVQIAGVLNFALKDVDGVQLAGVSNMAIRDVNKLQVAGVMNLGRDITGAQIAGVLNGSYGNVRGFQIAGIMNTSRNVSSLQLASILNVAADTVFGAQLAAVMNFGRHNRGFQLGLINIGDTVSGASIGLINLFLRGYNKIELHYSDVLPYSARLLLGTQRFYNIFGIGTQGFETNQVWGYTYGFGSAFRIGRKRNFINLNLTITDLQNDATWFEHVIPLARLELLVGFSPGKRWLLFAGPVWSNLFYKQSELEDFPFIQDIPPYTLYEGKFGSRQAVGWIGFTAGLRLL